MPSPAPRPRAPQLEAAQEAADSAEADYKQLRAQLDQLSETKWKLEAREAEVRRVI
jgi:hypothetical protein